MAADADQPYLIPGFFRCDRCGRDAERVARFKSFRFCAPCVEEIVPTWSPLRGGDGVVETEEQRQENMRFWEWFWEAGNGLRNRRRRACGASRPKPVVAPGRAADAYFPLCACGRPREPYRHVPSDAPRGLFGGPFPPECPRCDLKRSIESAVRYTEKIHPEWDDEEWLDHLYQVYPEAFELGVLPDYWFELRHPGMTKRESPAPEPVDPLARRPRRGARR